MGIPAEFLNSLFIFGFVILVPALRKAFLFPDKAKPQKIKQKRFEFFDFAKGIAITAVILIHAIYLFIEKYPNYDPHWLNIINNLLRFAVGFFFISSGALLTSGITKKKFIRVFAPYILVCVIIGVFQRKSIDLIVGGVLRGDLLLPYYFIPVLLQFYLLFPILNRLKRNKYFLVVTILISYLFYLTQTTTIFGVEFFGQYLYLFAFGMVYSDNLKQGKAIGKLDWWLILVLVYVVLLFIFPSYYYNVRYFFAPAVLVSFYYFWKGRGQRLVPKFILKFGKFSLWIYLIHFIVEDFMINLISFGFSYPVFVYIILITILTITTTGVMVQFIKNYDYKEQKS